LEQLRILLTMDVCRANHEDMLFVAGYRMIRR
jgi:hypothetical protein